MFTLGYRSTFPCSVWLVATSKMLVAAVLLVCAAAACAADPSNIVIVADQVGDHGALMIVYPTITDHTCKTFFHIPKILLLCFPVVPLTHGYGMRAQRCEGGVCWGVAVARFRSYCL